MHRVSGSGFDLVGFVELATTRATRALNPATFVTNTKISRAQIVVAAITTCHPDFCSCIRVAFSKGAALGHIPCGMRCEIGPNYFFFKRRGFVPADNEQTNHVGKHLVLNKGVKYDMTEFRVKSDPVFFVAESHPDHGCPRLTDIVWMNSCSLCMTNHRRFRLGGQISR